MQNEEKITPSTPESVADGNAAIIADMHAANRRAALRNYRTIAERQSAPLPDRITIDGHVYIAADASSIAAAFCEFNDNQAAAFFDAVGALSTQWDAPRVYQWSHIADKLSDRARSLLREWAEYFGGSNV